MLYLFKFTENIPLDILIYYLKIYKLIHGLNLLPSLHISLFRIRVDEILSPLYAYISSDIKPI